MATVLELVPALAAIGSLGAATASWLSVATVRKQWRVGQMPHMHVFPAFGGEGLEIYVSNAGPGIARNPAYAVASEEHWTGGWADPARMFLRPGETRQLRSRGFPLMGDDEQAFVVAVYLDADGFPHIWDGSGAHRVLRKGLGQLAKQAPFAGAALEMMYPGLKLEDMQRVEGTTSKRQVDTRVGSQPESD